MAVGDVALTIEVFPHVDLELEIPDLSLDLSVAVEKLLFYVESTL